MKNIRPIAACAVAVLTALSSAAMAQSSQPYSEMQSRSIMALSNQQVADLKAGRGMGLALAAELNGYPGPNHLLELSDKLALTSDQNSTLKKMFYAMKAELRLPTLFVPELLPVSLQAE
jgi:acetylornithine/succinyldiaminopimelate/putrescine aminotransferase